MGLQASFLGMYRVWGQAGNHGAMGSRLYICVSRGMPTSGMLVSYRCGQGPASRDGAVTSVGRVDLCPHGGSRSTGPRRAMGLGLEQLIAR